ncbi:MAG TPA: type II toxin-antitoxin system HicB family antitoxin [Thermoanaerobaculia bacterium]|nr:type II toxin-antitoxin system HicB family antitoxin [Thermoanaerobaculia bacterium]
MSAKGLAYFMSLRYPIELTEDEEGGYFVTHPALDGCMAEGATATEAIANLADSREVWIATRLDNGYPVPEPRTRRPSGNISLRMTPSLHARLAKLADRDGVSLNFLITSILARHAGGEDTLKDAVAAAASVLAGRSSSPPPTVGRRRSPHTGPSRRSRVRRPPPAPQPAAKA